MANQRSRKPSKSDQDSHTAQRVLLGAGAIAAAAGAAILIGRKIKDGVNEESLVSDGPPWTLKRRPKGEKGPLIGRSVTINRPRQEVYTRWRDFTRFPDFMDNVRKVERIDDRRSRWEIEGPAGTAIELLTEITHDVPGERIAWRSTPESTIETAGEVLFVDAPPGRGTFVQLVMAYDPPAGLIGKAVAKIFQREPNIQARRDLRRFKQLLETGEVSTNASPSGRPSESPTEARI